MKKVFLVIIGFISTINLSLAASGEQITALANGKIKFEVTFDQPKDYVEVFIRKNEIQTLAQNITDSFSANGDGTFSYSLIGDGFVAGDLVSSRFYSHYDGVQEFTPQTLSPGYTYWGKSLIYNNPHEGSPYVTELADGEMLFTLPKDRREDYVEIFIRKNGIQTRSVNITSNYNSNQRAYYFTDTGYHAGDKVEVRFYSHKNGIQQFTPGRLEQSWSAHTVGAYPNPAFVTDDASYALGLHTNSNGSIAFTEVFFDIGFDYLTPFQSSSGPASSWITDRALAQTFNRNYLMSTVAFKGMYVRHCWSGEWININDTVYAPQVLPLLAGAQTFSLDHHYSNILSNTLLDVDFSCADVPPKTATVSINGVAQNVLAKGRVHFAYVVDHQ